MLDKIRHGTSRPGEQNGRAKLKNTDAKRIADLKRAGFPGKILAAMFSVSQMTISRIVNGKKYQSITGLAETPPRWRRKKS